MGLDPDDERRQRHKQSPPEPAARARDEQTTGKEKVSSNQLSQAIKWHPCAHCVHIVLLVEVLWTQLSGCPGRDLQWDIIIEQQEAEHWVRTTAQQIYFCHRHSSGPCWWHDDEVQQQQSASWKVQTFSYYSCLSSEEKFVGWNCCTRRRNGSDRHSSRGLQSRTGCLIITRQIKTENQKSNFYFAQDYFLACLKKSSSQCVVFLFFF